MHRTRVLIGVLGLVVAAGAVHAATPTEVTLFGQKYKITVHSLAGTYKNGVKIKQVTDWQDQTDSRKTKVDFVQGASPDKDRLFAGAAPQPALDTADQFYMLTGSDPATGDFNTTVSDAKQFFGGDVDTTKGGRVTDVLWLNDMDTGVKKDKNIVIVQFQDDDHYRFYDLDSLSTGFLTDEVGFAENHVIRGIGAITNPGPNADAGADAMDIGDKNAPFSGFFTFARTANPQYLIATGHPASDSEFAGKGVQIGIMDVNTTNFLPVLTEVTKDLPTHDDGSGTQTAGFIHSLVAEAPDPAKNMAPTSNVYWALYSDPEPGGASVQETTSQLVRVQIDVPADPATAKEGDIKVKALGTEDLMKAGLADTTDNSTNAIYGLGIGREITAGSGKRVIYLTDWNGNLFTLTPEG